MPSLCGILPEDGAQRRVRVTLLDAGASMSRYDPADGARALNALIACALAWF